MAIRILGDLKSQQAVQAFGDLPDRETHYYLICEVVVALGKSAGRNLFAGSCACGATRRG